MNLNDYLPSSDAMIQVAGARQVGASRHLLKAAEILRDKKRKENEDFPKEDPNDLRNDWRYKAGMISALNFILDLPGKADKHNKGLPEGEEV